MTHDPQTEILAKDRPPRLVDGDAQRAAELSPEQKGPQEKRRTVFGITKHFDWSELWEKVTGWGRG